MERHVSDWVNVERGANPFGDAGVGGGAGAWGSSVGAAGEEDMFGDWTAELGEGSRSCKVESGPVDRMVPVAVAKVSDLADQQSPGVRVARHSDHGGLASRGSSAGNWAGGASSVVPPTLPTASLERSVSTGTTQRASAPVATTSSGSHSGVQWGRVSPAPPTVPLARSASLPVTGSALPSPPTNGALPVPAVPAAGAVVPAAPFLPHGPYAASIWSFTVSAPSAVVREALLATLRGDKVAIVENAWQFLCTTPKDQEPMGPMGRLSAASPQLGTFSVWMHTVFQPAAAVGSPGGPSAGAGVGSPSMAAPQPQYPCLVEFSSASRCSPVYFRAVFDHVVASMHRLAGPRGVFCQVGVPTSRV